MLERFQKHNDMEVIAYSKAVRMSPRKVALVASVVRGTKAVAALDTLATLDKRAAGPVRKTIESAIANAVNNAKLDRSVLIIKRVEVTQGPAFKRFHPSTRGRVHPYKKRTSNIRVILEDKVKGESQ